MPAPLPVVINVEETSLRPPAIAGADTSTAGFIGFIPALPASPGAAENSAFPTLFLPTPVIDDPTRIQMQKITLPETQSVKLYASLAEFTRDYRDLIGDPKADDARKTAQAKADAAKGKAKTAALAALSRLGPPVLEPAKVEDFAPNTTKRQTLDAWRNLVHAVHGFFQNGGKRCYVVNAGQPVQLQSVLDQQFANISEVSIVAAPGLTISSEQDKIVAHCSQWGDRIAVLDPQPVGANATANATAIKGAVQQSSYAALYFPNVRVFDPTTQLLQQAQPPNGAPNDGGIFIGPSGHVAGVYAHVDATRGVYKPPANEPLNGVLALQYTIPTTVQDQLNSAGINLLRVVNGKSLVWGARTLTDGSDEFKYVNVRRYISFIRDSIQGGTQWVVFEPNAPALWQRLRDQISAFLYDQWKSGGLVGATPQQAFFVKCDATTNTPDDIQQGTLTVLIGIALLKPSEFIILRFQTSTG